MNDTGSDKAQPVLKRAVLYARFSPRPVQVRCAKCGQTRTVQASAVVDAAKEAVQCQQLGCEGLALTLPALESCEFQVAEYRRWCAREGWENCGEFLEKAVSGSDELKNRPVFFDAISACRRGITLVAWKMDRLFRDSEEAMIVLGDCQRRGIEVVSITEPASNNEGGVGKLVRNILLIIADFNREMGNARIRAHMLRYQANGRRMSACPPYGWMVDPADNRRLAEHPDEQRLIRAICDMRAAGASLLEIKHVLRKHREHHRNGSQVWPDRLLVSILKRVDDLK